MIPQPHITILPSGLAILEEDYTVRVWPVTVSISAGFAYDGASIPALAQPFVGGPFDPRRLPAATVHDWLYASHRLPRWIADMVFLVLLLFTGLLPIWRCIVDWWAVARYGRAAWDSHGPEEQTIRRRQGAVKLFSNPKKGQINE